MAKEVTSLLISMRRPSVAVNARAIAALKNFKGTEQIIASVLKFLKKERIENSYWKDKWHISPAYATMHVMAACLHKTKQYPEMTREEEGMAEKAKEWFIDSRHGNGLWGFGEWTAEETAHALLALASYSKKFGKIEIKNLDKAFGFLYSSLKLDRYPELYIGKGLYAPVNVIRAAILAALNACEKYL